MKILVLLTLILMTSFAGAQTSLRSESISKRVDSFSAQFSGLPYINGALGEGSGKDSNPLYRFDGFNCTTYVETVSALTLSNSMDDFKAVINKIRYKEGRVDFKLRNHMPSSDWIPNNQKQGILRDQTKAIFPREFALTKTLIDKKAWFLKVHNINDDSLPELVQLPYLPLNTANENPGLLERIPSGSIINIVRIGWGLRDKIGTDLDVSHQGFAIRKADGILYFRHASNEKKVVTEEPLAQYLQRMASIKSIGGINILQLL